MGELKLNLEIRHIEYSKLCKLAQIIDKAQDYEILLAALAEPTRLSLDDIDLIKRQFYRRESPSLLLLKHWSITGRRRPTVRTLLYYLHNCNLKRAEDFVKQSILGLNPIHPAPAPPPLRVQILGKENSPEIASDLQDDKQHQRESFIIDPEYRFHDLHDIIVNLEGDIREYSFESIFSSTNKFCHRPYDAKTNLGVRIGDGRFSSVFRAKTELKIESTSGAVQKQIVAAKLLKSECSRKYLANEINLARKIQHDNILELLGISLGYESNDQKPKYICLIYPYMQNGSLLSCLQYGLACDDHKHLSWSDRFHIAVKVARGISYLHNFEQFPIIHRDIKTANILIDCDLEPKVGDFTLVRQLDSLRSQMKETQFSQNIIGTSVYMPPEAFRGDISTKFDTFSFGIVLFELITGFRPFNEEEDEDLYTYISEKLSDIDDKISKDIESKSRDDEIGDDANDSSAMSAELLLNKSRDRFLEEILDKRAGEWQFSVARTLFTTALKATENRKKNRPELTGLLAVLEARLIDLKQQQQQQQS